MPQYPSGFTPDPPEPDYSGFTPDPPSSLVDTFASYIPQPVKSAWDFANKPLTDYLTDAAGNKIIDPAAAANYYDNPMARTEDQWKIPSWVPGVGGGSLRSLGAGMLEGAGDVVRGLTSPLNIGTMGAFKGASTLAESAPTVARGLQTAGRALSAPVAAQGALTALSPNATPGERLFGATQVAGGAAGMMMPSVPTARAKPIGAGALEEQLPVRQPAAPIEPSAVTPEALPVRPPETPAPITPEPSVFDPSTLKGLERAPEGVDPTTGEIIEPRRARNFSPNLGLSKGEPSVPEAVAGEVPKSNNFSEWMKNLAKDESGEFDPDAIINRVARWRAGNRPQTRFVDPETGEVRNPSEAQPGDIPMLAEDIAARGGVNTEVSPPEIGTNINDLYDLQGAVEQLHDWSTNDLRHFVEGNLQSPGQLGEAAHYGQGILQERTGSTRTRIQSAHPSIEPTGPSSESYASIADQIRGMTPNEVHAYIQNMGDNLYPEDIGPMLRELANNPTAGTRAATIYLERQAADFEQQGIRTNRSESQRTNPIYYRRSALESKGKSLEEVEATKKVPALERLGKLIGEDRAQKLASGQREIQAELKPIRYGKAKKLDKYTISSWSQWANDRLKEVDTDPSKPGLSVETKKYFPKAFNIHYRDANGNPIGTLHTDLTGEGIATLAVSPELGLRRGKIAFELLKEAFDRGVNEPSGITSDLTKNLIDRVKRLVKSESGTLDLETLYKNINKIIDDISSSKIGQTARKFLSSESGSADAGRLRALFEKQKKTNLTPDELAEAKQLAKGVQAQPAEDVTKSLGDRLHKATEPVAESGAEAAPEPTDSQSIAEQLWNVPRSLQSIDLPGVTSAAFRQSRPLAFTRDWFGAWNKAVKAFGSQEALDQINNTIKNNKYFQPRKQPVYNKAGDIIKYKDKPSIAEELGVKMTDVIGRREEAIASSLAEKIPGYGRYVKASNRAYTGFLNHLRAAKFEQLMDGAKASGRAGDMALGKKIADFVNNATGRGSLQYFGGRINFEPIAKTLGDTLYSPRALSARLAFMNPANYTMADPLVRDEYWKGLARVGASWGAFAGLASLMPGVHVSLDPNNADFGKIRVGNTRIDPGAGWQQLMVLIHREFPRVLGGGGTVSSTGAPGVKGKFSPFGTSPLSPTRLSLPGRYLYNQMNPSLRFVFDMLSATRKEPFDLTDRSLQLALPMYATDIADAAKDDNVTAEFFAPLLSSMGAGVQTYEKGSFGKPQVTPVVKKLTGIDLPTTQIGR